jgi:hypothetical protein
LVEQPVFFFFADNSANKPHWDELQKSLVEKKLYKENMDGQDFNLAGM